MVRAKPSKVRPGYSTVQVSIYQPVLGRQHVVQAGEAGTGGVEVFCHDMFFSS
nr:hypothetical protein [Candidatus Electrothrix aestuarii]